MSFKDVVDLLSAITYFLLVSGGITIALLLMFKPPERLLNFLNEVREYFRLVRKLKVGNFEAELDRHPTNSIAENPPIASTLALPQRSATAESSAEIEKPSEQKQDNSAFAEALALIQERKHEEGMIALHKAAALETDAAERDEMIAYGQYESFSRGNPQALADLRKNVDEHPRNSAVRFWLALALATSGRADSTISELHAFLQIEEDKEYRVRLATLLSDTLRDNEQYEDAINVLKGELLNTKEEHFLANLYIAMAKVYKASNPADHFKAMLMYELALQNTPGDDDLRFKIAYAYDDHRAPLMALLHYRNLLSRDPNHSTAMNNAAAAAEALSIPITAVKYYRQAENAGENIAMGNLAHLLIQAGFIDEALALLEKAQQTKSPHQRVLSVLGELASAQAEEDSRVNLLAENAKKIRKWRRRQAQSMLESLPDTSLVAGFYKGDKFDLEIRVGTGGHVDGTFYYAGLESKNAELKGDLEGTVITFKWHPVKNNDSSYSFLSSIASPGYGILIVRDKELVGYRVKGELKLDPTDLSEWVDLVLTKKIDE